MPTKTQTEPATVQVQTLSSRNYLHPATFFRLPNRPPEKTPHHQAARKPGPSQGQCPDPTPLTQKRESLTQTLKQQMRVRKSPQELRDICERNSKNSKPSSTSSSKDAKKMTQLIKLPNL
ncbi:hypothetical protein HPB50_018039 [Hyalomma asiaticum]|uniref:Uncharacterized protein n=1 Tax=Hyalomma asiaticum TaxID=266040 RepID=A0ACB7SDE5_HYAAI|nr:hypothetical protein HPB50_018039 [Hyalomma asiaticum]